MIILVTGASGFIGMNLVARLATNYPDARLIACDLTSPGQHDPDFQRIIMSNVEHHPLDVNDPEACLRLLHRMRPTHIVHAAAVTLATNVENDLSVNLHGTRHILAAAIATGTVQRFLFLSSSGVYSNSSNDRPCDEDHPLQLDTPYTLYKRVAELHVLEHVGDLDIVIARIGPVYGPYEHPRTSRPKVSMIFQLLEALKAGRTLKIYGTDTSRDWTHASDISCAIDGLLIAKDLRQHIYNVSCGIATNARTILATLIDRGLQISWQQDAKMADLLLDPTNDRKPLIIARLQADTNFHPQFDIYSGLETLLERTPQIYQQSSTLSGIPS